MNLGGNPILENIDAKRQQKLLSLFCKNKHLKILHLDGCGLSDELALKLIKDNIVLEQLDLSSNYLTDESLYSVAFNNTLKKLCLLSNKITDFGVSLLLKNKSITGLNIADNNITIEGLKLLVNSKL